MGCMMNELRSQRYFSARSGRRKYSQERTLFRYPPKCITWSNDHDPTLLLRPGLPQDGGGLTSGVFVSAEVHDEHLVFFQVDDFSQRVLEPNAVDGF